MPDRARSARRRCSGHARQGPSARPLAPARPRDCRDDLPAVPCIVGAGDSGRIGAARRGSSDTTPTRRARAPRRSRPPEPWCIVEPAAGANGVDRRLRGNERPQPVADGTHPPPGFIRRDHRRVADLLAQRRVGRRGVAGRAVQCRMNWAAGRAISGRPSGNGGRAGIAIPSRTAVRRRRNGRRRGGVEPGRAGTRRVGHRRVGFARLGVGTPPRYVQRSSILSKRGPKRGPL